MKLVQRKGEGLGLWGKEAERLSPGTCELLSFVDKEVEDMNRLWILRWGIFFFNDLSGP